MTNTRKKIYAAIAGLLMVVTTQAVGYDCNQPFYCEPQCDTGCRNVTFRADLLYWRPELCGLESAFGDTNINTTVNGSVITTTTTESDEEPHPQWTPGFRIGADASFYCMDVELDWTHFNGHATFSDCGQNGRWQIKYDEIDLIFGNKWCLTPCCSVTPFIGVRAVFIQETLKSHLETSFTSIIGNNTVISNLNDNEHIWGAGPEIGLEAEWYMGCDFSLYGSVDVVSYYGEVKNKSYDTDTFTSTVAVCNGTKDHCFDNLATDAAIGIRWDRCLCLCGCEVNYMLKLGLEQHRIYNMSSLGSGNGTLSLDGGIFEAGVSVSY